MLIKSMKKKILEIDVLHYDLFDEHYMIFCYKDKLFAGLVGNITNNKYDKVLNKFILNIKTDF